MSDYLESFKKKPPKSVKFELHPDGYYITQELVNYFNAKDIDTFEPLEAKLYLWLLENFAKKERPMDFYEPASQAAENFHKCGSPYRILHGANRSSKTYTGGAEAVMYATCQHPHKPNLTPNDGWVVSETYKVQEEASQKIVTSLLRPDRIKKVVNLKGGIIEQVWFDVVKDGKLLGTSKIGFKSSDSGVRNFAGAAKRWIWFDEEPPQEIYKECIARIGAGQPLDIWFTMTPIFQQRENGRKAGMSWVYRELYQKRDGKRISAFGMAVDDNKFLSREQIEEQKLKYTGVEYDIRIKGEFKLLSGNSVFDTEKIEQRSKCLPRFSQGYLDYTSGNLITFKDRQNGILTVFEPPKNNERYFIGADIGLGVGGDPSGATVFDSQLNQVAEIHGQIPPDQMGQLLIKVGKWYNTAWIGIEANAFGIACIDSVKRIYGKLYFSYKIDQRSDQRTKRIGWWTDLKTKPLMVGDFAKAFREDSLTINSKYLLEEMATYVLGDDGSTNAEIGCHDDRVIAAMIALQVRKKHLNSGMNTPQEDFIPANAIAGY